MSLGGGKYTPPPDNSVQVQREQQQYQDRRRQEEAEAAARQRAEQTTAFNTNRDSAIAGFRTRSTQRLRDMGLDPNAYSSLIENAIAGGNSATPNLDPNPAQYFSDSLLDTQIGRTQGDRRANFTRQATSAFGDNFERGLFGDDADDPFIDAVLGRQRGEAVRSLDLARQRGSLDERGYTAAMARLGEMESAGRATGNTLGGSVIQGYREQVRGIGDRAREAASGYTLGGDFNLGGYTNELNSRVGDLRGRLEGDVNTALSGQQFFDLGDILTRGGSAQGPVNPRTSMADVLAERERVRNTDRGVGGGGGVF